MRQIGKISILLFISGIVFFFSPVFSYADTALTTIPSPTAIADTAIVSKTYTLLQLGGTDGFALKGSSTSQLFYLPIKKEWDLTNVTLHLIVQRAAFAGQTTTLTLYLGEKPISTFELKGNENGSVAWDVTVPVNLIKGDLINLKLESVINTVEWKCDNPSYWVYINGDSTVTYYYKTYEYFPDLSRFPYPFINHPAFEKDALIVALPTVFAPKTIAATFNVANALSSRQTWKGLELVGERLDSLANDNKKNHSNIIFIGTAKELNLRGMNVTWPLPISSDNEILDFNHQKIAATTGVILLLKSPWNPAYALLVVTGNTGEAVEKAALMLRKANFSNSVLFNEHALVTEKPQINIRPNRWSEATFQRLGFTNKTAFGNSDTSLSYDINLPQDKLIKGMDLELDYANSPFLSKTIPSYLTLLVNGAPISGIILSSQSNKDKKWNIHINGQNLNPGENRLIFNFRMKLDTNRCTPDETSLAWTTLYASSFLKIDFSEQRPLLNFKIFDINADALTIAIPSTEAFFRSNDFIQGVLALGKKMLQTASVEVVDINALNAKQLTDQNVLYMGKLENDLVLSHERNHFPFYFWHDQLEMNPALRGRFAVSSEAPIGVVEVVPSLFNQNKSLLFISATSDTGYKLALDVLNNPIKNDLIKGNVVLVYKNGTFTSVQSQRILNNEKSKQQRVNIQQRVMYGSLALALCVALFIFLLRIVRKMKRYFSKNQDGSSE